LNVLGGIPTVATDYSPLWDINLGQWTQEAIDKGYRSRVTDEFQILGLVQPGRITGPGGTPYGSIGGVVNSPVGRRFLQRRRQSAISDEPVGFGGTPPETGLV